MSDPQLLTHPNIPKPLHGVSPRVVLGDDWWNETRQKVYAERGFTCFACGQNKNEDRFHNWLEAHEDYSIDYKKGLVELNRIVALCHTCHSFIHSGLLLVRLRTGVKSEEDYKYIMNRSFGILKKAELKPWFGTAMQWLTVVQGYTNEGAVKELKKRKIDLGPKHFADWGKWRLRINKKDYFSKFNSFEEWKEFYTNK